MGYLEDLHEFVVDTFLFGDDTGLTPDTRLFESGLVDSTGLLEILQFIEKKYGISVADEDLVPENFESLSAIEQYMHRKNPSCINGSYTASREG